MWLLLVAAQPWLHVTPLLSPTADGSGASPTLFCVHRGLGQYWEQTFLFWNLLNATQRRLPLPSEKPVPLPLLAALLSSPSLSEAKANAHPLSQWTCPTSDILPTAETMPSLTLNSFRTDFKGHSPCARNSRAARWKACSSQPTPSIDKPLSNHHAFALPNNPGRVWALRSLGTERLWVFTETGQSWATKPGLLTQVWHRFPLWNTHPYVTNLSNSE